MEAWLASSLVVDALHGLREVTAARLAESLAALAPRDLGGFIAGFYSDVRSRRTPAQVDLTVFSHGKFVK
jgi:hypothetical protein